MDSFTRNYSIILGVIVVLVLGFWIKSSWQPRVWELNNLLEADSTLADYPYQFRVRSFENGLAILSTPRNQSFPAYLFLQVIHPELAGKDQGDPAMVAAQQELIKHQKGAQTLILGQPDVERVDWELDVKWLSDHGVHASANP
ncbi:hypothetical protein [Thiorhodovibrio frisius]|uniref:Glutamate-ammonia-ligase adenylyltransferase n=1 Tax=Thiorhodovibrio frisius TaxID=631362 RepID=H8YYZ7_9GAMM|nr:hypothetical protein [Thiorhodovibrio frisius]EIC21924.1 hypothetical protein Thi970DRAFT_02160 [Thiorhodovibrio frisius]WPL24213.1 hypothetical protein Thiofri_04429 [Thiorhodovibrio frisius]